MRTQRQQRRRWQRTRNTRRVWGIGDNDWGVENAGTTTEDVALKWRAWGIGDHDGGIGRVRWAQVPGNKNGDVGWTSRRDKMSKWTSLTAEAPVCLRAQGIYNDDGGVSRLKQAHGIINDNGGVGRGQLIHDSSEGLETKMEAVGDRRQSWGIYDDNEGVNGGRWAWIIQQQQQRNSWWRIYDKSKG